MKRSRRQPTHRTQCRRSRLNASVALHNTTRGPSGDVIATSASLELPMSRGAAATMSESVTRLLTSAPSTTTLSLASALGPQLWQYRVFVQTACGSAVLHTEHVAATAGVWRYPCCSPQSELGAQADGTPSLSYDTCAADEVYRSPHSGLPIGACAVGA